MEVLASADDEDEVSAVLAQTVQGPLLSPVQEDAGMEEEKKETLRLIRENMASANMTTMQRLQQTNHKRAAAATTTTAHRRSLHRGGSSFDPMQIDFSPTVRVQDRSLATPSTHESMTSRSAGTATSQR